MALYREGKAAMAADGTVTGTGTNGNLRFR